MRPELNEKQQEAVEHEGGPILILAGAGSGKTRVLTTRIARLMDRGVPSRNIMAVTFTNKAAAEMRDRIGAQLQRDPAGLWIGTFHSLSARLLRREAQHIGFSPQFTIYDETDRLTLIRRLLKQGRYSPKEFKASVIQWEISGAKNAMLSPAAYGEQAGHEIQHVAADIFTEFNKELRKANAMDFDDLLLHPLTLFEKNPDRLHRYQNLFQHVLVDEFQDTNKAQYLFVKYLTDLSKNLCAVGDDDQSIYGWRGADVRNMLGFENDFPTAKVVRLEENYRSTGTILEAANGVIAENSARLGKTLFTRRPGGEKVVVLGASDERDEAEWVARELRSPAVSSEYSPTDITVLYRTNSQSRAFEDVFRRNAIRYRVVGSVSFYKRREIKDLVAYLRLIVNPLDDEAFMRAIQAPKRGVGITSLSVLQLTATEWEKSLLETAAICTRIPQIKGKARGALVQFAEMMHELRQAADEISPAAILESIIQAIDFETYLAEGGVEASDRLENVRALVSGAAEWSEEDTDDDSGTPVERYLASAALTTSSEDIDGDPDGVTLMTVHTGKGLEWPVVFLTGMEDGLFPLSRSMETLEGAEEERRLAYVGITRARDRLYLTWASSRRRNGQLMPGMPSRFLDEVPVAVVEERRTGGLFGGEARRRSQPYRHPRTYNEQRSGRSAPLAPKKAPVVHFSYEEESQDAPRYVEGERVKHRKFGSGGILRVSGKGRELKVVIGFDDETIGEKTLIAAYAGLERDWDGT